MNSVNRSVFEVEIPDPPGSVDCIFDKCEGASALILLAHGAGAGLTHPFMEQLAMALANLEISVLRFNLPYMQRGGRPTKPAEAQRGIKAIYQFALEQEHTNIFLTGKSYGGRMSSHLVHEDETVQPSGLIYYGFPLHAPGRASSDRAAHLYDIEIPMLFLQGTRDSLANLDYLGPVVDELQHAEIKILEDADHSFKTPKRSGRTHQENIEWLAKQSAEWISSILTMS